jgi:hypothetical protein
MMLASAALFAFAGADFSRSNAVAPPTKKSPPPKPSPQPVGNPQLIEAIQVLRSVRRTLDAADHDYGGHRAEAVRYVGAAERQLREALGLPGTGQLPPGPHFPEPQIISDRQLATCIPVLVNTGTFLSQANTDFGGHRARAIADLRAAIAELELALEYSALNNWGGDYRIFSRRGFVKVEPANTVVKPQLTTHQRVRTLHRTKPHHHPAHLVHLKRISARKLRTLEREAFAKLKGNPRNHAQLQMKYHPPRNTAAAKINTFAMHLGKPAPPPRKRR